MLTHRVAKYVLIQDEAKSSSRPSAELTVALDLLVHTPHFYGLLVHSVEGYEDECDEDEYEPDLIDELKRAFDSAMSCGLETEINVMEVFEKLSELTGRNYFTEYFSPDQIVRDIVEQMTKCLPNLTDVFCSKSDEASIDWLGGEMSSRQGLPMSIAIFNENTRTLEDSFRDSFRRCVQSDSRAKLEITPPPILMVSVLSSALPKQRGDETSSSAAPVEIRFPECLDLATCVDSVSPFRSNVVLKYDLASLVSSTGANYSRLLHYFRKDVGTEGGWYGGLAGSEIELVGRTKAIESNFFSSSSDSKCHPRILVYTRRDLPQFLEDMINDDLSSSSYGNHGDASGYLEKTDGALVSKGTGGGGHAGGVYGECDANESTTCSSETCSICAAMEGNGRSQISSRNDSLSSDRSEYDGERSSTGPSSPSGLSASALEEQADLALANRRLKEALDIYGRAISAVGCNAQGDHLRSLQDKRDRVSKLIKVDTSTLLIEKGERALSRSAYQEARAHYVKAAHNQTDVTQLKLIISEIDQCIKLQTASQKVVEAHAAMRTGKYQEADELFRCAIVLNPEKAETLDAVQASLIPLIKTENAQGKQKIGMQAFEEKRFKDALQYLTEAINLLPEGSTHLAAYYCDRASVHIELKEFENAIGNCEQALQINAEYGPAFFRLGAANFGLEKLDAALQNYERAVKHDSSLSDQVKVKMRQVNTAREVQQRKEREAERIRQREEEQRIREERRAKDEALKKERGEKAAQERAEKTERARIKEEERKIKADKEKKEQQEREAEKELERERQKEERLRKDQERIQERERAKLEKEKDRERQKKEKEQRLLDQKRLAEEEKRKKDEFAKEMERVEKARKDAEKAKEAEKVKARLDMEAMIAERERTRSEKASSSSAAGSSSGDGKAGEKMASNCIKCAALIDGSNLLFAIGHCNHRTICSICVLRMRTSNFGKQTWNCVECKVNLDHVVCTTGSKSFSKFQLPGNPGPDLTYDKKSRMFFPKEYYKNFIENLWKFSCRKCSFGSSDVEAFKKHIAQSHNESLCELCLSSERVFCSDVTTYTQEELEAHMQVVGSSSGHPSCVFCEERFVNADALVQHLFGSHVFCKICQPDLKSIVKVDEDGKTVTPSVGELAGMFCRHSGELLAHNKAEHFVCFNFACRDQVVAFKTEEELKAHTQSQHSNSWNLKAQTPSYSAQQLQQPQLSGVQPGQLKADESQAPTGHMSGPQSGSRLKKWGSQPPPPPPPPPPVTQSSSGMAWASVAAANSKANSDTATASGEGHFGGKPPLNSFDSSSESQYVNRSVDSDEFPPAMGFNIKAAEFKPSSAPTPPLDHGSDFTEDSLHSGKFGGFEDAGDMLGGVTEMLGAGLSGLGTSLLGGAVRGTSLDVTGRGSRLPRGLGSLDVPHGVDAGFEVGGILRSASEPVKAGNPLASALASEDSLDFDAVMRLPLNFDDIEDSSMPFAEKSSDPASSSAAPGLYSSGDGGIDLSAANRDLQHLYGGGGMSEFAVPPGPGNFQQAFGGQSFEGVQFGAPPGHFSEGNNPNVGSETLHSAFGSLHGGPGPLDAKNPFNPSWDSPPNLSSGFMSGGGNSPLNPPPSLSLSGSDSLFRGMSAPGPAMDGPPGMGGLSSNSASLDMLPQNTFPAVDWLRDFGMCMYRWTPDGDRVALHVRKDIVNSVVGQDGSALRELYNRSNCQVQLERQLLQGSQENFLVFTRGPQGHPLNQCALMALQMVGDRIKFVLQNPQMV